jgi:hypothetical protein
MLAPAEACHEIDHPNLAPWRVMPRSPPSSRTRPAVNGCWSRRSSTRSPTRPSMRTTSTFGLHLLSRRLVRPHGVNLDGVFAKLNTVV